MNKNIKRIIALTLTFSAYGAISAMTSGTYLDIITKPVYAASYSPDDGELKSLTVKSIGGDTLDLRDGYNGGTVKLNEDKEYYIKLTDDSDGIKINSKVEGDNYIVRIFTSDKSDATAYEPGDEILLGKGNTTLYVRTYESESAFRKAKNTLDNVSICEEQYTINVKKTTESSYEDNTQDSIYLYNIALSRGNLGFIKGKTTYDMKVDSDIDNIKITVVPEDNNDRVRINGSLVDSGDNYKKNVDLDKGKNEIKIKVTDDKDNQRTYTINITRGDASDTEDDIYLDNITISKGELDFSEDKNSYNVDLGESVSKIKIGAQPDDEEYLVTIDGDEVNSDDDYEKNVSLDKGKNSIKVTVEDEVNDKKRTYTLIINRGEAEATNTDTNTTTNTTGNANTSNATENTTNSTDKKTGWVETAAGWKYNDEKGKPLKSSWLFDKEVGVYCYLDENGLRKTGWFKDKDKWYMLNEKGAMLTGWYKEEVPAQSNTSDSTNTTSNTSIAKTVNWYYLNTDGSMKTGWLLDGGKWYYLNTNGTMQKGWLINSNSKYYLNDDGTMAIGTKTIGGKVYKFNNNGMLI